MTITSTQFVLFLEPGIRNIWHESWPPRDLQYVDVLNIGSMAKATETDAKLAGFGPLSQQAEGESIIYQDPLAPVTKSYTYVVKAGGYQITDRMIRDELYGQAERFERDLLSAVRDDQEVAGWNLINDGFNTNNTGFDGLALYSTAHTRLDGGATQANRPATDAALSLSALHDAVIQFRNWRNDRGRPFAGNEPRLLVVPPDLMLTAHELLDSQLKPGTANNDANVITRFGIQVKVVDYLTSTTAWFLFGENHDVNFLWRFRPESGTMTDFDTDIIKRKVRQGYATGFGEWRNTYGTDGTP